MTDIEQEARAEAEAWKRAEEYAPGDIEAQDDFVQGYLTASRSASPASAKQVSREAVADLAEGARMPSGGTLLGSRAQFLALADALLAAFTITEKGAE